jgi:lauroyl/myristoyl acyltransferase/predicted metal-dependent phosphoesterase TrpH
MGVTQTISQPCGRVTAQSPAYTPTRSRGAIASGTGYGVRRAGEIVAETGAHDNADTSWRPIDRLILAVIAVLSRLTYSLPWPLLSALATVGGWLSLLCSGYRRRVVLTNLRHIRAEHPPHPIVAWALGAQQIATHFRAVMATLRAGYRLPDTTNRLTIAGLEAVRPHLGQRGILIVAVHAGPYTLLGLLGRRWLAEQGFRGELAIVARMFRPFRSGALQVWFTDYFTRAGITIINVAEDPRVMARRLREILEGNGIIVLLVDEPTPTPSALVPFFDSQIKMPVGPVRLARATGALIVPTAASYGPGRTMTITLAPPQEPEGSVTEGMHRLAAALERLIARYPGQWGMLTPIWIDPEPEPPTEEEGHSHADLHLHTQGSDGLLRAEEWLEAARDGGIRVFAVTDHDHIATVRAWKTRDPEATRHILPGVELTARGRVVHLGVLFTGEIPEKLPRPATPLCELVRWARGIEGSLVVLVHPLPFLWRRQLRGLARAGLLPDAIESRFPFGGRGKRTAAIERAAARYGLAVLGGSDAHLAPGQIGAHATLFPGETLDDLVAAIRARQTRAVSLPRAVAIPRRVHLLQSLYSWLHPFHAWPGVAPVRARLLRHARAAIAGGKAAASAARP